MIGESIQAVSLLAMGVIGAVAPPSHAKNSSIAAMMLVFIVGWTCGWSPNSHVLSADLGTDSSLHSRFHISSSHHTQICSPRSDSSTARSLWLPSYSLIFASRKYRDEPSKILRTCSPWRFPFASLRRSLSSLARGGKKIRKVVAVEERIEVSESGVAKV